MAAMADRSAGLHLPPGKRTFVTSRLQRRLRRLGLRDFAAYLRLLDRQDAAGLAERAEFVSALTTNVTEVYREPHHFALLAEHLARWVEERSAEAGRYRIWSAGCASGEEPLSIAATCRAVLGPRWRRTVRILATDVDEAILARARARASEADLVRRLSSLPDGIVAIARHAPVAADDPVGDLQAGIAYAQHNLMQALAAPEQFDAIFCRNVTIYFSPAAQAEVHVRLRSRLAPGALLAIGHSERLLGEVPTMAPAGLTAFRRVPSTWRASSVGVGTCG